MSSVSSTGLQANILHVPAYKQEVLMALQRFQFIRGRSFDIDTSDFGLEEQLDGYYRVLQELQGSLQAVRATQAALQGALVVWRAAFSETNMDPTETTQCASAHYQFLEEHRVNPISMEIQEVEMMLETKLSDIRASIQALKATIKRESTPQPPTPVAQVTPAAGTVFETPTTSRTMGRRPPNGAQAHEPQLIDFGAEDGEVSSPEDGTARRLHSAPDMRERIPNGATTHQVAADVPQDGQPRPRTVLFRDGSTVRSLDRDERATGHLAKKPDIADQDPAIVAASGRNAAPLRAENEDRPGPSNRDAQSQRGRSRSPPGFSRSRYREPPQQERFRSRSPPRLNRPHSRDPPEHKPLKGIIKKESAGFRITSPVSSLNNQAPQAMPFPTPNAPPIREIYIEEDNLFFNNQAVISALSDAIKAPCMSTFESKYSKNFCTPFTGTLTEYPMFRERFAAFVHSHNPPLSEHQKLLCLLDHLQGGPAEKLQHMAIHGDNFKAVCNLLEERYGRQDVVKATLRAKLRTMAPPDASATALTQFHDTAFTLMCQLSNLGVDLSADSPYTEDLTSHLPLNILRDVVCFYYPEKHDRSMENIQASLRRYLNRWDDSKLYHLVNPKPINRPPPTNLKVPARPHQRPSGFGQTFAVQGVNTRNAKGRMNRVSCNLCGSNQHRPADCDKYRVITGRPPAQNRREAQPPFRRPRPPGPPRLNKGTLDNWFKTRANTAAVQAEPTAAPAATDDDHESVLSESESIPSDISDSFYQWVQPQDYVGYKDYADVNVPPDYEPEYVDEYMEEEEIDEDGIPSQNYGVVAANEKNGGCKTHLLECCQAQIFNPVNGNSLETIVFFDGGSTHSYIREDLAQELGLPSHGPSGLRVNTFGSTKTQPLEGYITRLGLKTTDGSETELQLHTSRHLTTELEAVFVNPSDVALLKRDRCAIIPSSQLPGVLIGRGEFHRFDRTKAERLPSGFEVFKTTLGPVLAGYGRVKRASPRAIVAFAHSQPPGHDPLSQMCENFWHIENMGFENPKPYTDDLMVHDRLRAETTINEEGRYEVPLIFKTVDGLPPSNQEMSILKGLSIGRLESNIKSLQARNPQLLKELDDQFHGQIDRKEVEVISEDQILTKETHVYTPHHSVIKTTSNTTKVREVYDGSAKFKGKLSLNDALHRGPVLLPALMGMLLRARTAPIIILCDIAKAFLQISICPQYRNLLRWFWLKDISKPVTEDNLLYLRFKRVPFGLKISPFLLAGVIELHLSKYKEAIASEMWRNCYVDNIMLSANSVEEALQKYRDSKRICADAQMNLREYASNSKEFNSMIPPEDLASLDKLRNLGIAWQCTADTWTISLNPKEDNPVLLPPENEPPLTAIQRAIRDLTAVKGPLTRRKALRILARIFDPLGLITPALVAAKLVIQQLHNLKGGWDDKVTGILEDLWKEATEDFAKVTVTIPRRISNAPVTEAQAHVFVDASSECYGFCSYLRCIGADGQVFVTLMFSRCKVKPLKEAERLTIPRMELMALMLGALHIPFLLKEIDLSIKDVYLWSDSTIALHQAQNDSRSYETWVENRVRRIRKVRDEFQVHLGHVRTADNPADIVSRGIPASELQGCKLWWHAAPWLLKEPSEWPTQSESLEASASRVEKVSTFGSPRFHEAFTSVRLNRNKNPLDTEPLTASAVGRVTQAYFGLASEFTFPQGTPTLPRADLLPQAQLDRCHTWTKYLRFHATVVRAAAIMMRRLIGPRKLNCFGVDLRLHFLEKFNPELNLQEFSTTDLGLIEHFVLRRTQLQLPPTKHELKLIETFEENGLIRVQGRLSDANLPNSAKSPIYLHRFSKATALLILHFHVLHVHCGTGTLLANVRMHYWFTHGRRTVISAINLCGKCRKLTNPHFQMPKWPSLPSSRVNPSRPFRHIGIDFFGPRLLKSKDFTSGKYNLRKFYVCIFCCMATRAVHLELVSDLSTEQFFHAFMRFSSRRFFPASILSDNGATFLAAREILAKIAPPGTVHGPSKQPHAARSRAAHAAPRPARTPLSQAAIEALRSAPRAGEPIEGNPPPLTATLDRTRPIRATRGRAPQRFSPPPPGESSRRRRVHFRLAGDPAADPDVLEDVTGQRDGTAAAAAGARTKKGMRSPRIIRASYRPFSAA